MTEEQKNRVLYDAKTKKYIAVTEQEFEEALKTQDPEAYKKFRGDQLLGDNYKLKMQKQEERKQGQFEKREDETDLDYAKRINNLKMQREAEQFSKTHETPEDIKRKEQFLIEEAKRSNALREQQFAGETPRQTEIRHKLEQTKVPKEEADALLQEYRTTHYELGTMTFNPIVMYEDVSGQFRVFLKDGVWEVQELQSGMWVRGSKYIIKDASGKPIRLTEKYENLATYDFLRQPVMADLILKFEDPTKDAKKKNNNVSEKRT